MSAPTFKLGPQIERDARVRPYAMDGNRPTEWRVLWVYAIDASLTRSDGEIAKVRIPYEKCDPGPKGGLFETDMTYHGAGATYTYRSVELDDAAMLRNRGTKPDEANAEFHGQMVYAIASLTYEAFRSALGRTPGWAFDPREGEDHARLVLQPFAMESRNAYYDRREKAIRFGFFRTDEREKSTFPPGKTVYSTMSSDIIAHEVSHAILDGLRPYFAEVTRPDVPAFHEAFADLMAIFQRFHFRGFLDAQLSGGNGDLCKTKLIGALAPEFGAAAMLGDSVRQYVVNNDSNAKRYDPKEMQPHRRGAVLTAAVLAAFFEIVGKRTRPLIRIRTGGRDELEPGELSADLLSQMTYIVQRTAAQFRSICIRAIDYCPPVDIDFGDYLRALVTADHELVPDDRYGYREALISAFRERGIYPASVSTMSERSLRWNPPQHDLAPIPAMSLQNLEFSGDPGDTPDVESNRRNAQRLGEAIANDPDLQEEIRLVTPGSGDDEMEPFEIASFRGTRRGGPDGQITFDVIADVVQTGWTRLPDGAMAPIRNGATLVIDEAGTVKYVIRKPMTEVRRKEYEDYISNGGRKYWTEDAGKRLGLRDDVFAHLCGGEPPRTRDTSSGKSWVIVSCPEDEDVRDRHPLEAGSKTIKANKPVKLSTVGETVMVMACDDGRLFFWRGEIETGFGNKKKPFPVMLKRISQADLDMERSR